MGQKKTILLFGPTASGKSKLAVDIAKRLNGEIVNAEVYQIWKNEILLQDDYGTDLILPKSEQIPRHFFKTPIYIKPS